MSVAATTVTADESSGKRFTMDDSARLIYFKCTEQAERDLFIRLLGAASDFQAAVPAAGLGWVMRWSQNEWKRNWLVVGASVRRCVAVTSWLTVAFVSRCDAYSGVQIRK